MSEIREMRHREKASSRHFGWQLKASKRSLPLCTNRLFLSGACLQQLWMNPLNEFLHDLHVADFLSRQISQALFAAPRLAQVGH